MRVLLTDAHTHTQTHLLSPPKKVAAVSVCECFSRDTRGPARVLPVFFVCCDFDLHICHLSADQHASTITWIITESHIKGQRCVQVLRGCRLCSGSVANHTYHQQLIVSSSLPVYVPPSYENPSTVCCHDIYDTARSYFIDAAQL